MHSHCSNHRNLRFSISSLLIIAAVPTLSPAQESTTGPDPSRGRQHAKQTPVSDNPLAEQLRVLQAQVATLEAALKQQHQGVASRQSVPPAAQGDPASAGRKRSGMLMDDQERSMGKGMGRMGQDGMSMTGGMPASEMSGMGGMAGGGMGARRGMMSGMSGMGRNGMSMMGRPGMSMMGQMSGMGSMQMATALPGFPGASHLYHIGATSFFLDHPQHITLTTEQQSQLNTIKEQALLKQATSERQIAEAEQELWVLTGAAAPDATKIETKIREIEKQRGDQRIVFIRAVGEAAQVLTDEQRQSLVGLMPTSDAPNLENQNDF